MPIYTRIVCTYMVHMYYDCSGVVPAHSSLLCEFVCLPTYESPDSALFRLVILGPGAEGGVASSDTPGRVGTDILLTLKAEVCTYVRTCMSTTRSKQGKGKQVTKDNSRCSCPEWDAFAVHRSLWMLNSG